MTLKRQKLYIKDTPVPFGIIIQNRVMFITQNYANYSLKTKYSDLLFFCKSKYNSFRVWVQAIPHLLLVV